MSHYRLRNALPSSLATDLAVSLEVRLCGRSASYVKFYMRGFRRANGSYRPQRYQYAISRSDDGGFLITETIGVSTDTLRLCPPLDGDQWRSDAFPDWLSSTSERLCAPGLVFYDRTPPHWGPYIRELR